MSTTPDRQYGRELATEPEVDQRLADHRDKSLLHDIDRNAALEVVRDVGGRVQFVRLRDGAGGPVIRETEVSRDAQAHAATIVDRQYEPPGTLVRTRLLTLARDANGRVSGASLAVS